MRKAIFLDRDGVLNQSIVRNGKPYPPASLAEVVIPDDVPEALRELQLLGYLLIGATNQPDVARGKTDKKTVESINTLLKDKLFLDDLYVCYHDDQNTCQCRKPLPGLLFQASIDHHIDLTKSFMIGDRWKDIEAGINAGCKTIWLAQDYDEQTPPRQPDFTAKSMLDAANWIKNTKESLCN